MQRGAVHRAVGMVHALRAERHRQLPERRAEHDVVAFVELGHASTLPVDREQSFVVRQPRQRRGVLHGAPRHRLDVALDERPAESASATLERRGDTDGDERPGGIAELFDVARRLRLVHIVPQALEQPCGIVEGREAFGVDR